MATEMGSSLKGKLVESLVTVACIHGSSGTLNVAYPFVDDEGIDLIFYKRGSAHKALFAQVKSRSLQAKLTQKGTFRTQLRSKNFRARSNYYLIFVAFDENRLKLHDCLWLIPTEEFAVKTAGQKKEKVIVFQSNFDSQDMWEDYRMGLAELPHRILDALT